MRLIDLHTNWILQYAAETTLFDRADAEPVARRLGRLQGYLTDTAIAFVVADGSRQAGNPHTNPWTDLDNLLTRYEAEFSGRLLVDPADLALYRSEPKDALTWGVLSVGGLDRLIGEWADFERLSVLYRRGVRVFQLASRADTRAGGSDTDSNLRTCTDLGMACLERLADIASQRPSGPRLVIDLAQLDPESMLAVLDWFVNDRARVDLLIPIHTHGLGALLNPAEPGAHVWDAVTKLVALGGLIAIDPDGCCFSSADQLAATLRRLLELPTDAEGGYAAIALSTNYLSLEQVVPGLDNVERLIRWLSRTFDSESAQRLVFRNGMGLVERMLRAAD